jgi:hypothetical protein
MRRLGCDKHAVDGTTALLERRSPTISSILANAARSHRRADPHRSDRSVTVTNAACGKANLQRSAFMYRTRLLAIFGVMALCLAACSQAQGTNTTASSNETLQITEWHGTTSFNRAQIFTTTIADTQKIDEAWKAIISLPSSPPNSFITGCDASNGELTPPDSFEFRFIQDRSVTHDAQTIVVECADWVVTTDQSSVRQFYYVEPTEFQPLWQTLHDLTGVPIPTVPTSSP